MKNLFALAPRELTGSAFWAWILSSLTSGKQENVELQKIALGFLEKALITNAPNIINVRTEVALKNNRRADIALFDNNRNTPFAIIENKVWSTPNAEHLYEQLENSYNFDDVPVLKNKIAMTWRYDTEQQWESLDNKENIPLITLPIQCKLLANCKHPIVKEYYKHSEQEYSNRENRLDCIKDTSSIYDLARTTNLLSYDDAQWKLIQLLTQNIGDIIKINVGNSSGVPWKQAWFKINNHNFFYRLDHGRKGYYLRLNYYTWEDNDTKQAIIHANKEKTYACLRDSIKSPSFSDWARIYKNESGKESLLWCHWLQEETLTVQEFRKKLTSWHKNFIKQAEKICC